MNQSAERFIRTGGEHLIFLVNTELYLPHASFLIPHSAFRIPMTLFEFRALALSFPETVEQPHFDITSFRVAKKIFATMNAKENRATLRFSEIDQSVFSAMAPGVIKPVPNKWAKYGWTNVDLAAVDPELLKDALTTAYCEVAPKRLSDPFTGADELQG